MTLLAHLTLTTGDITYVPWERPDAETDPLLPLVLAGTGEVPGEPGLYVDIIFPSTDGSSPLGGAAYFQLAREPGLSTRPIIQAVVCWSPALDESAWNQARSGYAPLRSTLERIGGAARDVPPVRPPVPWLAVWLLPYALDLAQDEPTPDPAIRDLAQIEQRIAVALGREAHVRGRQR